MHIRLATLVLLFVSPTLASAADLQPSLAKLRAVGPKGAGHKEAAAAWKIVAAAPGSDLTTVLAGMDGATPLAENWIRSAAEAIAQREGEKLPVKALEAFLADTKHAPRGRRLAYELIANVDEGARERLIPGLINDPSLELRHDAVAMAIDKAAKSLEAGEKEAAIAGYQRAFAASRDLDQIKLTVEKLKSLEQKVNLPAHLGFVMQWQLIGPFDNKGGKGFSVAYPPEALPFAANASYEGVGGDVKWIEHTTTDDYGAVDLNKALAKHKGAIAYAYATFDSPSERTADIRLGCINGNKVWVNGELVIANEVYHANTSVDQYIGQAKLKKGTNTILVKVCQNEQTEPWAQDWKFQLRVCDGIGTPVK